MVWLTFTPQAGHEQAGHRPALTLSPDEYNQRAGLALFCPMTTKSKDYPFEVPISGTKAAGVVLADQVKCLDWRARGARFYFQADDSVVQEVLEKLGVLLAS